MWQRDGTQISIWQGSMPDKPAQQGPVRDEVFDVAIVGGGITGLSLALLLQQQGKRCVVLEAEFTGFGTTGGTTAHLNTLPDHPYNEIIKKFSQDAAAKVYDAMKQAISLIEYQTHRYHFECGFRYADAFLLAENETEEEALEAIRKGCEAVDLPCNYTTETGAPLLFSKALQVPRQACFHPLQYLDGITRAFLSLGGIVYEQARVRQSAVIDKVHRVETERGVLSAEHLVYATHIPTGINLLHLRCMPWRSYALAAELEGKYPEGLYYDMKDPYHYYRSQQVHGTTYLIAGGKDHRTGDEAHTLSRFTAMEAELRRHFNVKRIVHKWSSQFYESADGLPYIGHLPGAADNTWVATGFGGNGMTYSQVAASLLSDHICGKQNDMRTLFSPSRIKPVAGFSGFIRQNAHVAAELIADLFRAGKEAQLADMAHGEARLLSVDGHSVAVYKDKAGKLHAIHAHCTHLGCGLKWNDAETSWDCPCHGARFDADGAVLNAPADEALQPVTLYMDQQIETDSRV